MDTEKMPPLASRRANACLAPKRALVLWSIVVGCALAVGSADPPTCDTLWDRYAVSGDRINYEVHGLEGSWSEVSERTTLPEWNPRRSIYYQVNLPATQAQDIPIHFGVNPQKTEMIEKTLSLDRVKRVECEQNKFSYNGRTAANDQVTDTFETGVATDGHGLATGQYRFYLKRRDAGLTPGWAADVKLDGSSGTDYIKCRYTSECKVCENIMCETYGEMGVGQVRDGSNCGSFTCKRCDNGKFKPKFSNLERHNREEHAIGQGPMGEHGSALCTPKKTNCPAGEEFTAGVDSVLDRDDSTCTKCDPGWFKAGVNSDKCTEKTTVAACKAKEYLKTSDAKQDDVCHTVQCTKGVAREKNAMSATDCGKCFVGYYLSSVALEALGECHVGPAAP